MPFVKLLIKNAFHKIPWNQMLWIENRSGTKSNTFPGKIQVSVINFLSKFWKRKEETRNDLCYSPVWHAWKKINHAVGILNKFVRSQKTSKTINCCFIYLFYLMYFYFILLFHFFICKVSCRKSSVGISILGMVPADVCHDKGIVRISVAHIFEGYDTYVENTKIKPLN